MKRDLHTIDTEIYNLTVTMAEEHTDAEDAELKAKYAALITEWEMADADANAAAEAYEAGFTAEEKAQDEKAEFEWERRCENAALAASEYDPEAQDEMRDENSMWAL